MIVDKDGIELDSERLPTDEFYLSGIIEIKGLNF